MKDGQWEAGTEAGKEGKGRWIRSVGESK